MSRTTKVILSTLGLGLAFFFSTVDTDRIVSRLTPSPGNQFTKTLESNTEYVQELRVQQTPITRVGIFLRRIREVPSDAYITLQVTHNENQIVQQQLLASDIDNSAPTYIAFTPPASVPIDDMIRVQVLVPAELENTIGLQTTEQDETFTSQDATLFINSEGQENPAAYETFVHVKPPLALQLAGLLVVGVLYLWLPKKESVTTPVYGLLLILASVLPIISSGVFPLLYIVTLAIALSGMFMMLRFSGFSIPFALFGANIFTFSTWFPLHILGGNTVYVLASLLPWISYVLLRYAKHSNMRPLLVYGAPFVGLVVLTTLFGTSPDAVASLKDVFLDPNQSPFIQKQLVPDGTDTRWYEFGSYIGFPAFIMSLLGVASLFRNREGRVLIGLLVAAYLLVFLPSVAALLTAVDIAPAHLSIYMTYLLAVFAAVGIKGFQKYLGAKSSFIHAMMIVIVLLSLLDQWYVLASVVAPIP